jgi:hypothetical protein
MTRQYYGHDLEGNEEQKTMNNGRIPDEKNRITRPLCLLKCCKKDIPCAFEKARTQYRVIGRIQADGRQP